MDLVPDQNPAAVRGRKSWDGLDLMLPDAPGQIVSRAGIDGAVSEIGDNVGVEGHPSVAFYDLGPGIRRGERTLEAIMPRDQPLAKVQFWWFEPRSGKIPLLL